MTLILPAAGPGARLFDVVPQMFDALDGRPGALGLNPAESAIVLVLDGLGARNLQAHSGHARFLSSHMGKRDVGQTVFPSTTAAALTSLLTGRAPGEHGIVGYRALVPERNLVSNQLTGWEDDGLDPLTWQRSTPLLEAEAGRRTFVVSNAKYARSAFTAATMRRAEFHAADALEARLDETINLMKEQMAKGAFMNLFMNATALREAMFMLVMAWMHLWSMTICTPKVKKLVGDAKGEEREKILADNAEAAYYSGKLLSGQFYIGYEFPKYFGRIDVIHGGENAILKASPAIFTGAPEE